MKHQSPTIVLTGGGSGGHITPLLSLARELKAKQPGCQIIYIGHKGDNFDSLKDRTSDFDFMAFIRAGKLRRYHTSSRWSQIFDLKTLALNIRDMARLPGSIIAAWRLLGRFKPDVVFSKGGFVAVPVGAAARLRRIPIVTHDSDIVPGLANRVVGRWAKVHATGMPVEHYDYPKNSIHYVGVPIDERIKKVSPKLQSLAKAKLKLPPDSTVLLLSGGGNGSLRLNQLLTTIAKPLLENNLSLHILHITGQQHLDSVKQTYRQNLPKNEQKRVAAVGFTPDFYTYVAAADLIISRGGATTIAELAVAGKACLIIPSPYLTGGHQLKNAEQLAQRDAAVVADESIQPDELLVLVSQLLTNDHRRFELARNLFAMSKPDAAGKLADIILKAAIKN